MKMKHTKIRVATYRRVSHEDQKKFGDSLATQKQHLTNFIDSNQNMVVVDDYCDEGISADKLTKRTELQRLLQDIKAKKIDLVIFTKLDRWFRSVAKYYKIQEVLEANNVAWQAILEDYETLTANGKFKVNIMLSVAQQERDRTSERIKDVFAYKISQGHCILPANSLHFPFTVKVIDGVKRVVHNPETEAMAYDWINHLQTYNSQRRATAYINDKYGKDFEYMSMVNTSKDTMLYGSYKGNDNYCEPYMTKKEWLQMQENLKKNIRVRKNNYIYVFSNKLKCPLCGSSLVGCSSSYTTKKGIKNISYYYKCNYAHHKRNSNSRKYCSYKRVVGEKTFEKNLVEQLKEHIEKFILEKEECIKKSPSTDYAKAINKVKDEIERLNKMYQKARIDEEDYDKEYSVLENKLKELEYLNEGNKCDVDLSKMKSLLNSNFENQYFESDKLKKQAFWSAIIKEIRINEKKEIIDIIFLTN